MNDHRLRTYDVTPPGGYVYYQRSGIEKKFGPEPEIMAVARQVAQFRARNHLPRSSIVESLENVDRQMALQLKNDPMWTVYDPAPFTPAVAPTNPVVNPPCAGCGAPV